MQLNEAIDRLQFEVVMGWIKDKGATAAEAVLAELTRLQAENKTLIEHYPATLGSDVCYDHPKGWGVWPKSGHPTGERKHFETKAEAVRYAAGLDAEGGDGESS